MLTKGLSPDYSMVSLDYDSSLMQNRHICVFLETARDIVDNAGATYDPPRDAKNTYVNRGVLHETLHQFLGPHSDPNSTDPPNPVADEGIMNYNIARTGTAAQNQLTRHQIRYIQKIKYYPGYR